MECTIDNPHAAAVLALLGGKPNDLEAAIAASRSQPIRLAAIGDRLVIRTSTGEAEVPPRVTRPGVLFVPTDPFAAAICDVHTRHYMEINANAKRVIVNGSVLLLSPDEFSLSPDPATAPESWRPKK